METSASFEARSARLLYPTTGGHCQMLWPGGLCQRVQQRLGFNQIARVEAFGEPGVERGEEGAGRVALALVLPEPRQAGRGAQLERLGLLSLCNLDRLAEKRLRLRGGIAVFVEENLGPQPVELGIPEVLSLLLGLRDAKSERAQSVVVAPDLSETLGE